MCIKKFFLWVVIYEIYVYYLCTVLNILYVKKIKVICFVFLCKYVIFKKKGDILFLLWKVNIEYKGKEVIFFFNFFD